MDATETPVRSPGQKRWRLVAAVWLSLPVVYLLSYRPARELWWRSEDHRLRYAIDIAYLPVDLIAVHGPTPVGDLLRRVVGVDTVTVRFPPRPAR